MRWSYVLVGLVCGALLAGCRETSGLRTLGPGPGDHYDLVKVNGKALPVVYDEHGVAVASAPFDTTWLVSEQLTLDVNYGPGAPSAELQQTFRSRTAAGEFSAPFAFDSYRVAGDSIWLKACIPDADCWTDLWGTFTADKLLLTSYVSVPGQARPTYEFDRR